MSRPNDDAREKPFAAEAMQESITEKIIQSLKEGVPLWTKPWRNDSQRSAVSLPTNVISGATYSGINILQLWSITMEMGYRSHGWAPFKAIQKVGARVKKGQKGAKVIFVNFKDHKDDLDKPEGKRRRVAFLKAYTVFNVDQIESLPAAYIKPPSMLPPSEFKLEAVRFAHDSGVKLIRFGSRRAAYAPSIDQIEMPDLELFTSHEAFSGTILHEVMHASGHPDRLARKYGEKFGDEAYRYEELGAELGSAFLCAQLGIPATTRSNASYIDHWIKLLGNDYTLLTKAASYASAGAKYMTDQVQLTREDRIMHAAE